MLAARPDCDHTLCNCDDAAMPRSGEVLEVKLYISSAAAFAQTALRHAPAQFEACRRGQNRRRLHGGLILPGNGYHVASGTGIVTRPDGTQIIPNDYHAQQGAPAEPPQCQQTPGQDVNQGDPRPASGQEDQAQPPARQGGQQPQPPQPQTRRRNPTPNPRRHPTPFRLPNRIKPPSPARNPCRNRFPSHRGCGTTQNT